jgi:DNA-binding transcriptional LysR family regulator
MDYDDVALFTRVVQTGSFTAAAAALSLPKSSVSRRVARLEQDLGVRLLQRTTRRLTLTDAGQGFFERVRTAIAGLQEAATAVREAGSEPRGSVRMTAPVDAFTLGLGEAISEFVKRYPGIQIELALTSRLVDLVGEGFDLAVRAGVLKDSTLIARKVGPSEAGLFASPAYLRRRGRPKRLADLGEHECLLYRVRGGRTRWQLTGPSGEESVEVRGAVSADEMSFLASVASAGVGIGLLPLEVVHATVRRGELVPVLPQYRATGAAVCVVLPSSVFVPSRVALLRDHLVDVLSKQLANARAGCAKEAQRKPRKARG